MVPRRTLSNVIVGVDGTAGQPAGSSMGASPNARSRSGRQAVDQLRPSIGDADNCPASAHSSEQPEIATGHVPRRQSSRTSWVGDQGGGAGSPGGAWLSGYGWALEEGHGCGSTTGEAGWGLAEGAVVGVLRRWRYSARPRRPSVHSSRRPGSAGVVRGWSSRGGALEGPAGRGRPTAPWMRRARSFSAAAIIGWWSRCALGAARRWVARAGPDERRAA